MQNFLRLFDFCGWHHNLVLLPREIDRPDLDEKSLLGQTLTYRLRKFRSRSDIDDRPHRQGTSRTIRKK